MGSRWATVTMTDASGRRYSLDVYATSTFDAAHMFVAHAKADPRNGIPVPTVESVFDVVVDGRIHRVTGKALQQWILNERGGAQGTVSACFQAEADAIAATGECA